MLVTTKPLLRDDLRALLRVGWPLILNNFFSIGVNVADTLMVGRLGATQLAALSIGSSLWLGIFLGGLGVLMALGPTVAQHYGANRLTEIGHDTRQAIWLALVIASVAFLLMHAVEPLLRWLRIEPEVRVLSVTYLHALAFGAPGLYLYQVLRQMNEGIGRTVPIMVVSGIALAINVGLSYCFIFGKYGAPPLGMIGSAVGSSMSFWCMLMMLTLYVWWHPFYARFALWTALRRPDRLAIRRLVSLGGPIGLSLLLQAGLFTCLALLMGTLGTTFSAAHQITLNYAGLVFMLPLGLAFATAVLVGQAIGRQAPREARRIGLVGIGVCCVLATTVGIITLFCAPLIARAYTHDAAVIGLASSLLGISAILQMGDGTQSAAAGALRGLKDTRVPMLINGSIYWGIGFATAYLLGVVFNWQAQGIWCGLALALCVAAVTLTLRFRYVAARRIATSESVGQVNNR